MNSKAGACEISSASRYSPGAAPPRALDRRHCRRRERDDRAPRELVHQADDLRRVVFSIIAADVSCNERQAARVSPTQHPADRAMPQAVRRQRRGHAHPGDDRGPRAAQIMRRAPLPALLASLPKKRAGQTPRRSHEKRLMAVAAGGRRLERGEDVRPDAHRDIRRRLGALPFWLVGTIRRACAAWTSAARMRTTCEKRAPVAASTMTSLARPPSQPASSSIARAAATSARTSPSGKPACAPRDCRTGPGRVAKPSLITSRRVGGNWSR